MQITRTPPSIQPRFIYRAYIAFLTHFYGSDVALCVQLDYKYLAGVVLIVSCGFDRNNVSANLKEGQHF